MKRRLVIIAILGSICLSSIPVYASLDDVNNFLSEYGSDTSSHYTEEYINDSISNKTLFIRKSVGANDSEGVDPIKEREIFAELSKQDWFDYNNIYCITFGADSSLFISFNEYDIKNGTVLISGSPIKYPWLINTEDELTGDAKKFIGRVVQELLQYNIDHSIDLGIGSGGEDALKNI